MTGLFQRHRCGDFGNRTAWPFDWRLCQALCEESSSAPRNNRLEKNLRCPFAPSKAAVAIGTSPPPYLKLVLRAAKVLFKASSRFKQKHSALDTLAIVKKTQSSGLHGRSHHQRLICFICVGLSSPTWSIVNKHSRSLARCPETHPFVPRLHTLHLPILVAPQH